MPQYVADAGDCAPSDVRFIVLKLLRQAATGFRQNLKISFNELPRAPIRAKLLEFVPCNIRLDVAYSFSVQTNHRRPTGTPPTAKHPLSNRALKALITF